LLDKLKETEDRFEDELHDHERMKMGIYRHEDFKFYAAGKGDVVD